MIVLQWSVKSAGSGSSRGASICMMIESDDYLVERQLSYVSITQNTSAEPLSIALHACGQPKRQSAGIFGCHSESDRAVCQRLHLPAL